VIGANDLALPARLPKPNCRVVLVCGPPGAGKSTYVRGHMQPGDPVIDIDLIAKDHGYSRWRPEEATGMLLAERNERLALLSLSPCDRVAWVIVGAPGKALRAWWRAQLNVAEGDMVLLVPPRAELIKRVKADPDRKAVIGLHTVLIDQWFRREHENEAPRVARDCDASGWPVEVTEGAFPWH
jgi:hypothetical protein